MASNDGGDLGSFMTGLIIGGLVGAGVALLMAPQSGEETREIIHTRGVELRDRADEEIAELRRRAETTMEEMRHQVDELSLQAKKTVDDARGRLESGIAAAKKPATEAAADSGDNAAG